MQSFEQRALQKWSVANDPNPERTISQRFNHILPVDESHVRKGRFKLASSRGRTQQPWCPILLAYGSWEDPSEREDPFLAREEAFVTFYLRGLAAGVRCLLVWRFWLRGWPRKGLWDLPSAVIGWDEGVSQTRSGLSLLAGSSTVALPASHERVFGFGLSHKLGCRNKALVFTISCRERYHRHAQLQAVPCPIRETGRPGCLCCRWAGKSRITKSRKNTTYTGSFLRLVLP